MNQAACSGDLSSVVAILSLLYDPIRVTEAVARVFGMPNEQCHQ